MADTITASYEAKVILHFADDDTRTISVPNGTDAEQSDCASLVQYLVDNKIFVGDKAGAELTGVDEIDNVQIQRRVLDIG